MSIEVCKNFRSDRRKFAGGVVEFDLRVLYSAAVSAEVLAVERRKKPALGFRCIAELVSPLSPKEERLLHEIAPRIRVPGKAQPKAVQRAVMAIDKQLECLVRYQCSDESAKSRSYSRKMERFYPKVLLQRPSLKKQNTRRTLLRGGCCELF